MDSTSYPNIQAALENLSGAYDEAQVIFNNDCETPGGDIVTVYQIVEFHDPSVGLNGKSLSPAFPSMQLLDNWCMYHSAYMAEFGKLVEGVEERFSGNYQSLDAALDTLRSQFEAVVNAEVKKLANMEHEL